MQIDYFDLPLEETLTVSLPWPMKFFTFKQRRDSMRLYYVTMPQATEQEVKFYCIKSEVVMPDTFPGQYLTTVFADQCPDDDNATHIFMATPVNKPAKPHIVEIPAGAGNGAN